MGGHNTDDVYRRGIEEAQTVNGGAVALTIATGAGNAIINGLGGPLGIVMQVGVQLFGTAIANIGDAVGYMLLNKAADETDAAAKLAREDTPEWCATSGQCSAGWQHA